MKEFGIGLKLKIQEYWFLQNRHNDIKEGNAIHYIGRLKTGTARLSSGDTVLELAPGDVFYIPRGVPYQSTWLIGEEGVKFDSFGFSELPASDGRRFGLQKLACDADATALLNAVAQAAEGADALEAAGHFFLLLARLMPSFVETERKRRDELLVSRALLVLREDPTMDIPTLASALSVSESGLYAAFRTSGYATPNGERQKLLIMRAVELLVSTDRSVEDISATLGFSSSSYFRKIFAKFTQKSPRTVRKEGVI